MRNVKERHWAYKNQHGVEVFIILHDVNRVMLGRLLLVCDVEIEAGVITLDRLEKCFKSVSEAALT